MSRSVFYGLLAALGFAALAQGEDCNTDTGGTCSIWGCSADRGPTVCTKVSWWSHHCICEEGYCAVGGICRSAAETPAPTPPPAPSPTPPPTPPLTPPPTPSLTPTDDFCHRAYDQGCYAEAPFKSCCAGGGGGCQSAKEDLECNWGFELPCCGNIFDPEKTKFKFNVGGQEDFCRRACVVLGDMHNNILDYCPDGKLMKEVQLCENARTSLERAVGKRPWCSSHHEMTCQWSYAAFSHKQGGLQHVSGQFNFTDDNAHCTEACEFLGQPTNRPDEYCGNSTTLAAKVSQCPQAKASFDSTNARWCEGGVVSLAQARGRHEIIPAAKDTKPAAARAPAANRSLPSSAASPDEVELYNINCHRAFEKGCWSRKPFSDCCGDCSKSKAAHSCSWSFSYNGEPSIGGTLEAFPGELAWGDCDHACDVLANTTNNPEWFCHPEKSPLKQRIKKCPRAEYDVMDQSKKLRERPTGTWCAGSTTDLGFLSSPGQSRFDPVIGTAVVAVALAMAAAIAVKIRARPIAGEDGYQPFLG